MKQPAIIASAPAPATRPLPAEDRAPGTVGTVNRLSRRAPKHARMSARANTWGSRDQGPAFAAERRQQIVHEMTDDYVSWREACATVAAAYENWTCAAREDKKRAFSVYVAALDREEKAATAYQRAVAQVATA